MFKYIQLLLLKRKKYFTFKSIENWKFDMSIKPNLIILISVPWKKFIILVFLQMGLWCWIGKILVWFISEAVNIKKNKTSNLN